MIENWLKIYYYQSAKNKVNYIMTLFALAIGLSGAVLFSMYYMYEQSFDKDNVLAESLFIVETKIDQEDSWMMSPFSLGPLVKEQLEVVEDYTYVRNDYYSGYFMYEGKRIDYDKGMFVQANFLEFFPMGFSEAQAKTLLATPNSVVIESSFAKQIFGDKDPIGEQIFPGKNHLTITGVFTQKDLKSSFLPTIIFGGYDVEVQSMSDDYSNYYSALWLKLRPNADLQQVVNALYEIKKNGHIPKLAQVAGVSPEQYLIDNPNFLKYNSLHSFRNQHTVEPAYLNGTPEPAAAMREIKMLLVLSWIILFMAVFNFINIRFSALVLRSKEIGVMRYLGGSTKTMFSQYFIEVIITMFLALISACVLIELSIDYLNVFFNSTLSMSLSGFVFYGLIIIVLFSILIAWVSTFVSIKQNTLSLLKGHFGNRKKSGWVSSVLLTVQYSVVCFFVIGALFINLQIRYMQSKDLGFNSGRIVSIDLFIPHETRLAVYDRIRNDWLNIQGVEDVSLSSLAIAKLRASSVGFSYNGNEIQGTVVGMSDNFLDLYGIELLAGRKLNSQIASDSLTSILINQKTADLMQETNPVGKRFKWNTYDVEIVGVVDNFHSLGLESDYQPMVFMTSEHVSNYGRVATELSVKLKSEHMVQALRNIEQYWKDNRISDAVFSYEFVDKRFEQTFNQSKQNQLVFNVLNVFVFFIGLFGLYSLCSMTINSELKNVAIRKVLGASKLELVTLLSKKYFVMCFIGFALAAFPAYYFVEYWLSGFSFRITMLIWPFIVTLFTITLFTGLITVIKALQACTTRIFAYIKYE